MQPQEKKRSLVSGKVMEPPTQIKSTQQLFCKNTTKDKTTIYIYIKQNRILNIQIQQLFDSKITIVVLYIYRLADCNILICSLHYCL